MKTHDGVIIELIALLQDMKRGGSSLREVSEAVYEYFEAEHKKIFCSPTFIDGVQRSIIDDLEEEEVKTTIKKATDNAVQRAYDNSKKEWRRTVLAILEETCKEKETFTVNDFRSIVRRSGVETHDNRAMGGLMRSAQAKGWITPTGNIVRSKVGHNSPLQIWKSLIYQSVPAAV